MGDGISITLFGIVKIDLPPTTAESIRKRFSRRTLFSGPCLLVDRRWGLALDSTTDPREGTRPVLWTPHAAPWQQWRLQHCDNGLVKIVSEHGGLVLTTDARADNGSWVWLSEDQGRDQQKWRLRPTEDRTAFLIETASSSHALDALTDSRLPAASPEGWVADPTAPILWSSHWASWQQWMLLRLPLT